MNLKELLRQIRLHLADAIEKKFTGQIVFTLHLRRGAIGKAVVRREYDLVPVEEVR